MGRYELEYPKDATNVVKRRGERGQSFILRRAWTMAKDSTGIYALERIHGLINTSQILHVSFTPPDSAFPVTLPMIGQMGSFDRPSASIGDPLDLYIHGFASARMFNVGRAAGEDGVPVCVAASHVDGIVLALSGFNHSYNYRSAVLFGHASLVTDEAEKMYALELITDSVVPHRWRNTRLPPTGAEMQSTGILRVKIKSGSAKIRDGGAVDDKSDLENEEALNRVWTGVVPVHTAVGEPVPSEYNRLELPEYVSEFLGEFNDCHKHQADAATHRGTG
ncbi:FMN-binding split barrel [Purpureocillium lilacinum]|uniref:FMN-binding split barrel n=1 Tax=Purpureocillium lilacinum TaxID=33203 RepID=A0A179FW10_PURLI|nr:FMN-binding split barrel [Purpureocillium lilacinum]OAQ69557.1 FMN-binding split barrel [Purpureocillium lilacinum]